MTNIIPTIISTEEILIRFLFENHFNNIKTKRIKESNVFFDSRSNTVSLQRGCFLSLKKCIEFANNNKNQHIGYITFNKSDFDYCVELLKKIRGNPFEAEIQHTPLDEHQNYIVVEPDSCTTNDLGNPSHADIVYINPNTTPEEEPKIPLQLFSKKLITQCNILYNDDIDTQSEDLLCSEIFKQ